MIKWIQYNNGAIVYRTTEQNRETEALQSEIKIKEVFTNTTKETIEELEKIHIYGIGYEKWIEIWKQTKTINPIYTKNNPARMKKINGNIMAEYLRIIREKEVIITNDPETLYEVMEYAQKNLNQKTLDTRTYKMVRLYVGKRYKKLQESIDPKHKNITKKYKEILEKTADIQVV